MTKIIFSLIVGAACIIMGAALASPVLMALPCIAVLFATVARG